MNSLILGNDQFFKECSWKRKFIEILSLKHLFSTDDDKSMKLQHLVTSLWFWKADVLIKFKVIKLGKFIWKSLKNCRKIDLIIKDDIVVVEFEFKFSVTSNPLFLSNLFILAVSLRLSLIHI